MTTGISDEKPTTVESDSKVIADRLCLSFREGPLQIREETAMPE